MEDVLASLTTDISTHPRVLNGQSNGKNCKHIGCVGAEKPDRSTLLLTFDDGYIDNYTFAMPLLEQFGFQGSFFIPCKTFTEHKLLDVNKIHYILASAEEMAGGIKRLVQDLFEKMDFYRGYEFDYPSNNELYKEWAVPNRFDNKDIVFIKRILQTVLPEQLRNRMDSLIHQCKDRRIGEIVGYYYPTPKNGMVKDFYKDMGFKLVKTDDNTENTDNINCWEFQIPNNYDNKNQHIEVSTQ